MKNYWVNLLQHEEKLKEEIVREIETSVVNKLHLDYNAIDTACHKIAEEALERLYPGRYELDIKFNIEAFKRKYRHYFTPETVSVFKCEIKSFYLDDKNTL